MKLIIDIPEVPSYRYRDMYTAICENGYIYDEDNKDIAKAIKNGTPIPDNATNGEVIQALFPKLEYKYTVIDEYTNKPTFVQIIDGDMILTNFSTNWWNAPYQKGSKNE